MTGRAASFVARRMIAEKCVAVMAYCATFDKCCQTQGLTPVNVATCLSYTEARVARCSSTDAKWWGPGDGSITTSLFVPASVAKACGSFLDLPRRAPTRSCGAGSSCGDGTTCAIDECAPAAKKGGACTVPAECLDGVLCKP